MTNSQFSYDVLLLIMLFFLGGWLCCRLIVKKVIIMISKSGFVRLNYKGQEIPVGAGAVSYTHLITDIDTAQKIEVSNGKIVGANIQSIQPGQRGKPGEKIGVFDNADTIVGSITAVSYTHLDVYKRQI